MTMFIFTLKHFYKNFTNILGFFLKNHILKGYDHLKNKLDEAHDLIQILQGLKLDSEESDEVIDHWTQQRNSQVQSYETALEKLAERLK